MTKIVSASLFPFLSAWLLILASTSLELTTLAWVALVPLCLAIASDADGFDVCAAAFVAFLLYHLIGIDWIRTSYGGVGFSGPKSIYWFVLSLYETLVFLLIFALARRFYHLAGPPMAIYCPLVWFAIEEARFYSLTPLETVFPWLRLGLTQSDHPIAQVADLGGVGLVSIVLACVSGCIADTLLLAVRSMNTGCRSCSTVQRASVGRPGAWAARSGITDRSRWRRSVLIAALVAGSAWVYGWWRTWPGAATPGPTIALTSRNTLDGLSVDPVVDLLLTHEAGISKATDDTDSYGSVRTALSFAQENNVGLALGIRRFSDRTDRVFNCLLYIDRAGVSHGFYDKRHLVPWSEFTPWIVTLITHRPGEYTPGVAVRSFECEYGAGLRASFVPVICADVLFPSHFRSIRPDFYVAPSNENFDRTGQLSAMMLATAKLRAIENRRSIVRNSNAGVSGIIDGNGHLIPLSLPLGLTAAATLPPVPIDARISLYALLGDWPTYGLWLICGPLLVLKRHRPGSVCRFWESLRGTCRPRGR